MYLLEVSSITLGVSYLPVALFDGEISVIETRQSFFLWDGGNNRRNISDLFISEWITSTHNRQIQLPKIPQSLIEYFVQQQGNMKEVMVKYEEYSGECKDGEMCTNLLTGKKYEFDPVQHAQELHLPDSHFNTKDFPSSKLKINTAGTIIWKPVEEKMYTQSQIDEYYQYLCKIFPNTIIPKVDYVLNKH